jgi:hypothetical protein
VRARSVAQQISRQHAEIVAGADPGTFTVKDRKSKNGVFVNDRRIDAHLLAHGDVLVFGGATANTKLGDVLPQPLTEFRYTFEVERAPAAGAGAAAGGGGEGKGDESVVESTFASLKALTENITVIFTWLSSLLIASQYLFAEENSDEFSYLQTYVKPVFDFVHVTTRPARYHAPGPRA